MNAKGHLRDEHYSMGLKSHTFQLCGNYAYLKDNFEMALNSGRFGLYPILCVYCVSNGIELSMADYALIIFRL